MELPLVNADDSTLIWAILFGLAALGFWGERKAWGKKLSGAMIAIIGGLVLSNLKIIPTTAPAFETVWTVFIPLAIPLLLFKADLRKIFTEAGPTLIAFLIGAAATTIGAVLAFKIINLSEAGAELTGIFAATYIGGSMNFTATSQALEFSNPDLLSAAIAADNVVSIFFLLLLAAMPVLARKFFPPIDIEALNERSESEEDTLEFNPLALSFAIGLSFLLVKLGVWFADIIGISAFAILTTTALAVMLATAFPRWMRKLSGDFETGTLLLYVFFGTIGAGADLTTLAQSAPILAVFATIVVGVHFIITFPLARLAGIGLAETITASNACVMGPATAAGLAAGNNWRSLITPGILAGILGYAIASFIGIWLGTSLG